MSDFAHTSLASTTETTSNADRPLFDNSELRQFDADDGDAGRRIAKILGAIFIYTIAAMGVAIAWSFSVINH